MSARVFTDFAIHEWGRDEYMASPAWSRSKLLRQVVDDDGPSQKTSVFGDATHMRIGEPDEFDRLIVIEPESWDPPVEGEGDEYDQRIRVRPKFTGAGAKDRREQWEADQAASGYVTCTASTYGTTKRALFREANENRMVLSAANAKLVDGCVEAIRRVPLGGTYLGNLLDSGRLLTEHSITFTDASTGLRCKQRRDIVVPSSTNALVIDIKTAEDPSETAFMKAMAKYNYDTQAAFYGDAESQRAGGATFVFLVVGKTPDFVTGQHRVGVYEVCEGEGMVGPLDSGRRMYSAALDIAAALRGREGLLPRYWDAEPRRLDRVPAWHVDRLNEIEAFARSLHV